MVGCNPKLRREVNARQHQEQTGHRVARKPQRTASTTGTRPVYEETAFGEDDF